jgi:hypothetical protein
MTRRASVWIVLIFLGCAPAASAQSKGRVAVGIGMGVRGSPDEGASAGLGRPGLIWRIGHGSEGWGVRYGLNWFSTQLHQPVGPANMELGRIRVRTIMGGYGYQKRIGRRTLVGGGVLAGYGLTSVNVNPQFEETYRRTLGVNSISVRTRNTFVLRPEMSVWIDLTEKMGLNISSNFMMARPEVTVFTPMGPDTRRVRADTFSLRVGAVYSIF